MKEYLKYMVIFLALFITACDEEDEAEAVVVPDGLTVTGDYSNFVTIEVEIEADDHDDHDDHGDHDDHDHGDDDDGHSVFSGFQLWEENMTTATYSQIGLAVSGEITLAVGETKEYMVMFLDDDDDHDHGDEEHCEDFTTEADCGAHAECEWHADDMACEDADGDHGDEEHCEDFTTEADCGAHAECEWHADDMACEDADGDDHDHGDDDHEEGAGHISITGVSAGTTSFQVKVMHNGHADYTSLPIDITVTAGSSN